MAELTIITQNLNQLNFKNMNDSEILEKIKGKYKAAHVKDEVSSADIYAFQELGKVYVVTGRVNYITETLVANESLKDNMCISGRAEEIWDDAFPWLDFRTYLDERNIIFAGEKIKIINFHSSPEYDHALRYVLFKRLSEIEKRELTILLGDFNAGFLHQTKIKNQRIIEGANFLNVITECGFIECTAPEEQDDEPDRKPHYTYEACKKWDHIFISKSLLKLLRKYNGQQPYTIEYIDEVKRVLDHSGIIDEVNGVFTDHSGIKLTITLPDPKEDPEQSETPVS